MKTLGVLALLLAAASAQAFQTSSGASQGWDQPLVDHRETLGRGPAVDVAAIGELVTKYQAAVRQKDEKALFSFYLSDAVPVTGAFSVESYAFVTAANKTPVPRFMPMTAKESVPGELKQDPDKITDLVITTDGAVGTVSYAYSMAQGHGRIAWTVLRSNEGWKIAGVVYSINVAAAEKK